MKAPVRNLFALERAVWIDVTDFNNTARYAQSLFAITALADDRALGTPIALTDRAIRAHNRVNELVNSR